MTDKTPQQINDGLNQLKKYTDAVQAAHEFIGDYSNKERLIQEINSRLARAQEKERPLIDRLQKINDEVEAAESKLTETQKSISQKIIDASAEADKIVKSAQDRAKQIESSAQSAVNANMNSAREDLDNLSTSIGAKLAERDKLDDELFAKKELWEDLEAAIKKAKAYLNKLANPE